MLVLIKKNKGYIIIVLIIVFFIILYQDGLVSTKQNKISKNMELRKMFQSEARKADTHQRAAEKNWSEKYFNIIF